MAVFLSYARADSPAVQALVAELDTGRLPYWIDLRNIPGSVPWLDEIREAIRTAPLVVLCQSPRWRASEHCQDEADVAEEFGKRIVAIDLVTQSARDAVTEIRRALERLEQVDHLHTELLLRSAVWDRAERRSAGLVGRRLLGQLSRVDAVSRTLTPEARAFLIASRRRVRQRTLLRVSGIVFVGLCLLAGWLVPKVETAGEGKLTAVAKIFTSVADVHRRTSADPFDGLQAAAQLVRGGNQGGFARYDLVEALNVPVPIGSVAPPGPPVVGLIRGGEGSQQFVRSDGQVADATGSLRYRLAGATTAAATDASGRLLLWADGGGRTRLRMGESDTAAPCQGTLVALTSPGTMLTAARGRDLCVARVGGNPVRVRLPADATALAAGHGLVAAGLSNGQMVVVDIAGRVRMDLSAARPAGPVTSVAVSEDDMRVATVRADTDAVDVVDIPTGTLVRRIAVGGPIASQAFSPDRRTIAAAVRNGVVLVDVETGSYQVTLRGVREAVRAVEWSSDGKRVWAVSGDTRVSQWVWRTGERLIDDPASWFVALTPSGRDGRGFAVTQAGRIDQVDGAHHATTVVQSGIDRVLSAAADQAGQRLLLGTSDHVVDVYDIASKSTQPIAVDGCLPISTAFIANGQSAVVGCYEGSVLLLDLGMRTVAKTLPVPYGGAGAITVGSDDAVYVGAVNGAIYATDARLSSLTEINDNGYLTEWRSVSVSADGSTLFLVGVGTGRLEHATIGHRSNGKWSWDGLAPQFGAAEQSRAAAISPDGRYAAIGMADGSVSFWLANGETGWGYMRTEAPGAVLGLTWIGGEPVAATREGVVTTVDGCGGCESATALLGVADRRLADARAMGLTTD